MCLDNFQINLIARKYVSDLPIDAKPASVQAILKRQASNKPLSD